MGHNIHYAICEDTENARKNCEAYWNECAAKEDWQEGCSGLSQPIRWLKHTPFDTEEAAREYIEKNDKGWYDQLAVRFFQYPNIVVSKTYKVLEERAKRLQARYEELRTKVHYEDTKSAFITCRNCQSKLAGCYIGSEKRIKNICPVCSADLRPKSTLAIIDTARKNAEKAKKDLIAEERKLQEKQKKQSIVKWLVKIEYHT